jgi:hypothetical protein
LTSPVANRKRAALVVPAGASHFTIRQLVKKEDGSGVRMVKMVGPPDDTGQVPDSWPVSQFSPRNVLEMWGEGKYRVDWYQADGERVPQTHGEAFDVAKPERRSHRKLSANREQEEPEAPPPPLRSIGAPSPAASPAMTGQIGLLEMLALLDKAREQASERDRAFFLQMQQSQATLLAAIAGRGPSGGDAAASLELMQQRMALEMDKRMFELRREMLDREEPEEPDDGSDLPPPADMSEAVERIGMSFLSQLEGAAPELVQKMVPRFLEMLQSQGLQPSAEMQRKIAQAQNGSGHANGR